MGPKNSVKVILSSDATDIWFGSILLEDGGNLVNMQCEGCNFSGGINTDRLLVTYQSNNKLSS